jgi:hypothetical protein
VRAIAARRSIAVALAALTGAPLAAARDEPSLKDVVRRMGVYVASFGEKTSIVVATERYTQEFVGTDVPSQFRVVVADFAIVKPEHLGAWTGYRDVIEVDGTRVADREDRLIDLLTASRGGAEEARRLWDENARFNIGPVRRDFNVPTTALFFFTAENIDRFKFSRKRVAADGTWEIAYRETARPTMIRTPEGASIASAGSVWVNPADGTVLKTSMQVSDFVPRGAGSMRTSGRIDVTYRRVDALGMWLPATMSEVYEGVRGLYRDRITTRAEYSNYRTFQTAVRIK